MLIFFVLRTSVSKSKMSRETNSEVNKEATRPTAMVTAKPWTAPLDSKDRNKTAISEVTWESMMVQKARLKPMSMDVAGDLPAQYSSLMRSKMITLASTVIPTVNTRPAMPVRVRVILKTPRTATTMNMLINSARLALIPEPL